MKNVFANKRFLALLLIWTFLNVIFLSLSDDSGYYKSELWPFTTKSLSQTYDKTEFLLYVFGPIVIGFAYSLFKNNGNEK